MLWAWWRKRQEKKRQDRDLIKTQNESIAAAAKRLRLPIGGTHIHYDTVMPAPALGPYPDPAMDAVNTVLMMEALSSLQSAGPPIVDRTDFGGTDLRDIAPPIHEPYIQAEPAQVSPDPAPSEPCYASPDPTPSPEPSPSYDPPPTDYSGDTLSSSPDYSGDTSSSTFDSGGSFDSGSF